MNNVAWIMVRQQDRYLLAQRSFQDKYGGLWTMPGGKQDKEDQNVKKTATRELQEEVGLFSENFKELFNVVLDGKRIYVFLCETWSGEPTPCHKEIVGVGWFTIPQISRLEASLSPWCNKMLPQLAFLVRHDHIY